MPSQVRGTPSQVWVGGVIPSQIWLGGLPHPRSGWGGTPSQVWLGGTLGTSPHHDWMGYPHHWMGYLPPSLNGLPPQHSEHLLHGGWYASCVHVGGLSYICVYDHVRVFL